MIKMKFKKSTKYKMRGHFGMFILYLITKRKNKVKRADIMNIYYMKSIVFKLSKIFGACIIIFIR